MRKITWKDTGFQVKRNTGEIMKKDYLSGAALWTLQMKQSDECPKSIK